MSLRSQFPVTFSRRVVRPEQFGTPTGTDPNVDMPLLDAAINILQDGNGGVLLLTGTYAYTITSSRKRTVGPYRNVEYGFNILGSNICVTGGGTLKLAAVPSGTNAKVGFLVGRGLYDIDEDVFSPGTGDARATIISAIGDANGSWVYGFQMDNINFDNSILTTATEQAAATKGVINSVLMLSGCHSPYLRSIHIDKGYGGTGAICTNALTHNARISDVTVDLGYTVGAWFDGAWDGIFENIRITNFNGALPSGIVLAPNTDYGRVSRRSIVRDCYVSGVHAGITIAGGGNDDAHIADGNTVENNEIWLLDDNITHVGVSVSAPAPNANGAWSVYGNQVLNNVIRRSDSAPSQKGEGIAITGASNANGTVKAAYSEVHGNVVGEPEGVDKKITYLVVFAQYSEYNTVTNNTIYGSIQPGSDQSGGTAVGNVSSPNTVL